MMENKDIKEIANKHLDTPEVPRDRMWERIDAARSERRGIVAPDFKPKAHPVWRVARLAAGMAAVLVVGVLIGRTMQEGSPVPSDVPVPTHTAGTEVQGPGLHDPVAGAGPGSRLLKAW